MNREQKEMKKERLRLYYGYPINFQGAIISLNYTTMRTQINNEIVLNSRKIRPLSQPKMGHTRIVVQRFIKLGINLLATKTCQRRC